MAGKKRDTLTLDRLAEYVKDLRRLASGFNEVSRQMREEHGLEAVDVVGQGMAIRGVGNLDDLLDNCKSLLKELDRKKKRASRQTVSGES